MNRSTWYVYLEVSDEYYHLVLYLFLNTVVRLVFIINQYDYALQFFMYSNIILLLV